LIRGHYVGAGILIISCFLLIILATFKAGGTDDAFITYTFARNLSLGYGISWYPGGPPVYGSTTFTYTVILALAGYLGSDILTTSMVLGALFWSLSYVLVYIIAKDKVGIVPSLLILLLGSVASIRIVFQSLGMEAGLYTFLALLSFVLYARERLRLALIVCALLIMTRLDGALVPALILSHYVLAGSSPLSKRMVGLARAAWPMTLVLATWLVFLQLYFGTVLPNSFRAKLLYGEEIGHPFQPLLYLDFLNPIRSPGGVPFGFRSEVGLWVFYAGLLVAGLFILVAGVGVVRAAYQWRNPWALVLLWIPFYVTMFYVSGMRSARWYYVPLFPVLYFSFVYGARWLVERLPRGSHSHRSAFFMPAASVILLVYGALLISGMSETYHRISSDPFGERAFQTDRHHVLAKVIRRDMQDQGLERTSVMAFEVGYIGYYVPGRVHDILGLVSPDVVKKGGFRKNPLYILEHHKPRYAAITVTKRNPATGPIARSEEFQDNYKVIYTRVKEGAPTPYKVFRRTNES
jgi:hypothetical protein